MAETQARLLPERAFRNCSKTVEKASLFERAALELLQPASPAADHGASDDAEHRERANPVARTQLISALGVRLIDYCHPGRDRQSNTEIRLHKVEVP
jgi:hypothetical protein